MDEQTNQCRMNPGCRAGICKVTTNVLVHKRLSWWCMKFISKMIQIVRICNIMVDKGTSNEMGKMLQSSSVTDLLLACSKAQSQNLARLRKVSFCVLREKEEMVSQEENGHQKRGIPFAYFNMLIFCRSGSSLGHSPYRLAAGC